jgi:tRNA(Ile)-lysidine synthase
VAEALRRWLEAGTGRPPDRRALDRVGAVVHLDATAAEVGEGWRVARTGGRLRLERVTGAEGPPLG